MVHLYQPASSAQQALHRLNQRRDHASQLLDESIDRAAAVCNRASALQRRVLQQKQSAAPAATQRLAMSNAAIAAFG